MPDSVLARKTAGKMPFEAQDKLALPERLRLRLSPSG
jgi:hypothetical protein